MSSLDCKATELRLVVEDMIYQVRTLNAITCGGPHAELTVQELHVIEYLGDSGPRMMRELAECLLLAVNSVTSIVDKMERKDLVQRRRSDEDRRVVHVELTDAGRTMYEAAVKEKLQFLRGMLAVLNEDEREIFMVLFRKIARAGRSQVQTMSSPD